MESQRFTDRFKSWALSGIPVGRIRGIPVSVHLALFLVALYWLLLALTSPRPLAEAGFSLLFLIVLLGSILLHELGHCYGAHLVGGETKGILLWPLGGIASITGAEKSPYDEFVVVLLGPAVSLLLALGATFSSWLLALRFGESAVGWYVILGHFLDQAKMINWMLFAFNMAIPLFPMDCARLIRALCSMKYDPQKVTYNLCLAGFFVAGAMSCLYLVGLFGTSPTLITFNIFFLLIAAFGLQSCLIQLRVLEYSYVYSDPGGEAMSYRELLGALRITFGFAPRRGRSTLPAPPPIALAQSAGEPEDSEREILRTELEKAIDEEDFVKAAEIRDKLKSLTAGSPKA
ncbi:UvrB/UvrC motif-containing protein [Candidatus Sumerlaeota bacterium]|nr:UvrB/UvrC motif-containing protein [Candidatus Sumerlaeota bacterium]